MYTKQLGHRARIKAARSNSSNLTRVIVQQRHEINELKVKNERLLRELNDLKNKFAYLEDLINDCPNQDYRKKPVLQPDGTYRFVFTYANTRQIETVAKYPDLIGKSDEDWLSPASAAKTNRDEMKLLIGKDENGKPIDEIVDEEILVDKQGKTHIFLVTKRRSIDPKTGEFFINGYSVDITEKFFLQKALQKSQQGFKKMAHASLIPVNRTSASSKNILYANEAFHRENNWVAKAEVEIPVEKENERIALSETDGVFLEIIEGDKYRLYVDENLTEEKLAELSKKTSFGDVLTRLYKKIIDEDIRLYGKIIDTVNRDHEAPEQQNLFNEELSRKKMRELLTVHRTRPDDDGLTSEVTFITSAVWVDPSGPEEEPEIIGWDIPTRYDHYMKAIYYDQLTDVYNKKAYLEFLTDVISQAYKKKKNVAYIYIDINGFKKINDEDPSHHHVGDMILKAFGRRIKAGLREKVDDNGMFRETDAVYRFGGDEFVIVLGDIETEAEAEAVWDRIDKAICQKVTIDNKEYSITASRGLFLYRPDIDGELSLEEIQKIADTKMYADKRKKKSVWHRFIRFLGLPD